MSSVAWLLCYAEKIRESCSFGLRASFGQHHAAVSAHGSNELPGIVLKNRQSPHNRLFN